MNESYIGLIGGLAFAIVLVYLLIVVNFQSWLDPFIIITALPARRLAGDCIVSVHHGNHAFRPGADGRDHVHGCRDCELDPGGLVCEAAL